MPSKLRTLKSKAIQACENHRHVMHRFIQFPNSAALGNYPMYSASCVRCGMEVIIKVWPMANEIDISGKAVAVSCDIPWYSDFVSLAWLWHGGQYSALYEYASNKGEINYSLADRLIPKIEDCLKKTHKPRYIEELKLFRQYVRDKKATL